jgi:MFS family permease
MRKHIATGAMGAVYFSLVSGIYLVTFGNAIGLVHWQWALLSAASSLVLLLQLLSAYIVSRLGSRKAFWFYAAMCSRLLRGGALAVSFWLYLSHPSLARAALIALVIVANCFDAVCAPPWLSWLADIIPSEHHGSFMGRRSAWTARASLLVILPMGLMLDRVSEGMKMPALMAVFSAGFLIGAVDLLIHRTIPEPPMVVPPRRRFWREAAEPLRDSRFRARLVFNVVWTFSMTLGGSLAAVYFVEDLGIKRNFLGGGIVLIIFPLMGSMAGARALGAMVDRYGIKRMLLVGHLMWAVLPAFWMVATPGTALWWLGASSLLGGLAGTTALTAAGKLITRLPPPGHVPMYVAVSTCVGAVAGSCGPALAGVILHVLRGLAWQVGPVTVVGFHALFALSLVLRLSATSLIRRISEPTVSEPARETALRAAPEGTR